jgi:hypothetical protein
LAKDLIASDVRLSHIQELVDRDDGLVTDGNLTLGVAAVACLSEPTSVNMQFPGRGLGAYRAPAPRALACSNSTAKCSVRLSRPELLVQVPAVRPTGRTQWHGMHCGTDRPSRQRRRQQAALASPCRCGSCISSADSWSAWRGIMRLCSSWMGPSRLLSSACTASFSFLLNPVYRSCV